MLPDELIAIQEIGERPDPYWSPTYSWTHPEQPLVLDEDEQLLWWGNGNIEARGSEAWKVQGFTVAVTDRRIVWFKADFDKGGGWVGIGPVGIAVALTANAVSKKRAKERSVGMVLIGQVRFEWIRAVAEQHLTAPLKIQFHSCILYVPTTPDEVSLEFDGGQMGREGVAVWLAYLIRQHRALQSSSLTAEQITELAGENPIVESSPGKAVGMTLKVWALPGDNSSLIAAELAKSGRSA